MNGLRSRTRRSVLLAGTAAAAMPALGHAAGAAGARGQWVLSGRVLDAHGQAVRGRRLQLAPGQVALTDGDGRFLWRGPMPADQALRCEMAADGTRCLIEADLASGLAGPGVAAMTLARDSDGAWRVTLDIRLS